MLKILEEHTPELIDTPQLKKNKNNLLPPRKPLPVANNVSGEEDLSFEEVSQRSSEIDEKEARIIKFLEQEEIAIANPKEKEWEYAQNVKQKAFLFHSNSKKDIFAKRFTLDNADLFQKRRSSCLELGKAFLSPLNTKSKNPNEDESPPDSIHKKMAPIKRTNTNPFALRNFNPESPKKEEAENENVVLKHNNKSNNLSLLHHEILKDLMGMDLKNEEKI